MPHYKLPKEEHASENELNMPCSPTAYDRRVRIPINDEILDALEVGDKIDISLVGEVTELTKHNSEREESRTLELTITEVKSYPDNSNDMKESKEEEAQKSYRKGFKKAFSPRYREKY